MYACLTMLFPGAQETVVWLHYPPPKVSRSRGLQPDSLGLFLPQKPRLPNSPVPRLHAYTLYSIGTVHTLSTGAGNEKTT